MYMYITHMYIYIYIYIYIFFASSHAPAADAGRNRGDKEKRGIGRVKNTYTITYDHILEADVASAGSQALLFIVINN